MKKRDVIIACDFPSAQATLDFLKRFEEQKPFVKIGMELFYGEGPDIVRQIKAMGHDVFLDLKLHDIPNTVNKAMRNLARLGVNMTNVHAAGTMDMMRAAKEGLAEGAQGEIPMLIAVTQLTSTSEERMQKELLISASMEDAVRRYAQNAQSAGLDGVDCSPLEAGLEKGACGLQFCTVTPGIRYPEGDMGDQSGRLPPKRPERLAQIISWWAGPSPKQKTRRKPIGGCAGISSGNNGRRRKNMENIEKKIAGCLLEIKAVFLRPQDPFTWASGIKSPIYCDNRLTLSYPAIRSQVEQGLAENIRKHYPDCQVVAGTSTAGIAHAALVADILGLPMCYVRGSAKDHGRNNQIEGKVEPGQKVVVVEDLISTGGSVIEVVNVLREAGAQVLGVASIFTYGLQKGVDRMEAAQVKNVSLSNYDALIEAAAEQGYIQPRDVKKLQAFQSNPSDESWMSL